MLSVKDNINEVLRFTDRLSRQYEFAVAVALTNTAREVAKTMPREFERAFEGGTVPFTRNAMFTTPARKDRLTAVVGVKDKQAQYLVYQVLGGERQPKRQALRLPGQVQLTAQGNLPAGTIGKLIARARADKRSTKALGRKVGVSSSVDLFYGDPTDGRPAGIYKRVVTPGGQQQLVPLVVFPRRSARYRARLDFFGIARRQVQVSFEPALRQAWARAKATAR